MAGLDPTCLHKHIVGSSTEELSINTKGFIRCVRCFCKHYLKNRNPRDKKCTCFIAGGQSFALMLLFLVTYSMKMLASNVLCCNILLNPLNAG